MKQLLLMMGAVMLFSSSAVAATNTPSGQAIFDRNCSVCHSVNPPPKSAPPIVPMASRYHLKFRTKEEAVAHIAAFLKTPDKAKAIDQQAVTRFGLMPPSTLSAAELRIVAGWVWDQYNPNMGMGFGGQGMGRGRMNP